MLAIALILVCIGIVCLNYKGSLAKQPKSVLTGLLFNLVAVVLFCQMYGFARGIFVFLGAFALIGIVVTLSIPIIKPRPSGAE
ncbi:MAG: hypothetical protein ABJK37_07870 [Paraglaciecola sp.]|uniref:hypothetical protein n=1 Tax=Paraglaciecola sp. TaxID=1920173 RepID=UPI00329A43C9